MEKPPRVFRDFSRQQKNITLSFGLKLPVFNKLNRAGRKGLKIYEAHSGDKRGCLY